MSIRTIPRVAAPAVAALDPYAFFAVLGKRVIHPGGRRATEELFRRADLQEAHRVLDVGCGVATTAIQIARRFGWRVTAVDISPLMLARARANVGAAGLETQVIVESGDITALRFPDNAFDRIVAEAVTMFVDRPRAARELVRVCRPGGRVLATEFYWRKPPTPEARGIFPWGRVPGHAVRYAGRLAAALSRGWPGRRPSGLGSLRGDDALRLSERRRAYEWSGHHVPDSLALVLHQQDGLADAAHGSRRALPRLHRCRGDKARLTKPHQDPPCLCSRR